MCAEAEASQRVYLGLSVRSMLDRPGMLVLLVNTESPAWAGDMKVGDVLLEIDGRPINMVEDLFAATADAHGQTSTFKVMRKGQLVLCRIKFPPLQSK